MTAAGLAGVLVGSELGEWLHRHRGLHDAHVVGCQDLDLDFFVREQLDDHVGGADPKIIALLRDVRLPLLRWPGGNFVSGNHWRDGVGPVDARPAAPDWPLLEPGTVIPLGGPGAARGLSGEPRHD